MTLERTVHPGTAGSSLGITRTGPSPAGFVPLNKVGNPIHVYWADDPLWSQAVDSTVTTWPDRGSVVANLAGTGTPTLRAGVAALGGRRAIQFTADVFSVNNADIAQDYAMLVVFARSETASAVRTLISRDGIASTFDVGASGTYTLNAGSAIADGASNVTSGQLASLVFNGASSAMSVIPAGAEASGNAGAGALTQLTVANAFSGGAFQGHIAFVGVYGSENDLAAAAVRLVAYYGLS